MAQKVKHLSAMRETWVRSLGVEDPLEKEMATHTSISWSLSLVDRNSKMKVTTGGRRS